MTNPVTVLIADDHELFRIGLRVSLQAAGLTVVGEASDGADALRLVHQFKPASVVLDVRMPGLSGIDVAKRLQESVDCPSIVVLSTYDDPAIIVAARNTGAAAYLSKETPATLLAQVIRSAVADPSFRRFPAVSAPSITAREIEVLRHLALGNTNREIADSLGIGAETVKDHLQNLFRKLESRDRTSALARAYELGVLRSRT